MVINLVSLPVLFLIIERVLLWRLNAEEGGRDEEGPSDSLERVGQQDDSVHGRCFLLCLRIVISV